MQPVVCHVVRRDSSARKFDRAEIAFISALFYWLKPLTDEELGGGGGGGGEGGRKPEYPEKSPDDELQKIPQTKARKFKPQPRFEPAAL